jgi:hypothetical protein
MHEASTTQTPRRRARALGWALAGSVVALLMLGSLGGASVLAVLGGNQLSQTTPISSDDVNFQGSDTDCAGTAAGTVVWHFVLTRTTASTALLEVTFANAGTATYPSDFKTGSTLHWFVTTGSPDTLLAASTNATGKNLNLSHICDGGETTTTETTNTTTTAT